MNSRWRREKRREKKWAFYCAPTQAGGLASVHGPAQTQAPACRLLRAQALAQSCPCSQQAGWVITHALSRAGWPIFYSNRNRSFFNPNRRTKFFFSQKRKRQV